MPVNRVKLYFLYAILFLVFTQGFWERYTPIPAQPILEILIIGITLLSYKNILNPLCYKYVQYIPLHQLLILRASGLSCIFSSCMIFTEVLILKFISTSAY